jgi:lipopolysaccharide export system permease protein
MILYNNHVLPESNHKLLNLLIDINKKKPTIEIKENVFIDAFEGYKIYVRHKDDKTGKIRNVQIFESDDKGNLVKTITAERGRLEFIEASQILRFELENAEIHEMPQGNDASTYRRTVLKKHIMNIKDIDRSLKRSERNYRGDREMSAQMMRDKIGDIRNDIVQTRSKMARMASLQVNNMLALLEPVVRDSVFGVVTADPEDKDSRLQARHAQPKRPSGERQSKELLTRKALESQSEIKNSYLRQIDRYRVEIHKKYSIPFACVIFVLIGSPIAVRLGRSGMNTAIGLSILVFLVYYVCLIGGEKLADRRILSPVIAMWVPNVIFGIAAGILIRRTTLEQGAIRFRFLSRFKVFRKN